MSKPAAIEQPTQSEIVEWLRAITRAVHHNRQYGGSVPFNGLVPFYERFVKPLDDREKRREELEREALVVRDRLIEYRAAAEKRRYPDDFYLERISTFESRLVAIDAELEVL